MSKHNELKTPKFEKKSFIENISNNLYITYQDFLHIESERDNQILIFDTNFLFVPFEFRVEIMSEIKRILGTKITFAIVEETLKELESIEQKKTKNKKFLPLIATFLKTYNVSIITNTQNNSNKSSSIPDTSLPLTHYVDDILLQLPTKWIIATNDKELKQTLWKIPRRVIFMRQKSYLDIK
ncbi:MAG: PIN domain-containing protein [Candidatus Nanoarchaeia archaeon]